MRRHATVPLRGVVYARPRTRGARAGTGRPPTGLRGPLLGGLPRPAVRVLPMRVRPSSSSGKTIARNRAQRCARSHSPVCEASLLSLPRCAPSHSLRVRGAPPARAQGPTAGRALRPVAGRPLRGWARARMQGKAAVGFEPVPLPPPSPPDDRPPQCANRAAVPTEIRGSRLSDLPCECSPLDCPRVRGLPPWRLCL